jgi:hypothetical protein
MSSAIQPASTDRVFGPALLPCTLVLHSCLALLPGTAARRPDEGVLTPPL